MFLWEGVNLVVHCNVYVALRDYILLRYRYPMRYRRPHDEIDAAGDYALQLYLT